MNFKRIGAIASLASVAALGAAGPANATTTKPENTAAARPANQRSILYVSDGTWYCSSLTNGQLCIRYVNNYTGIDVHYHKSAGSPITVRFSYTNHYLQTGQGPSPWGPESAGQTNSAVWNNSPYISDCEQGLMEVQGQGVYYSPSISRGGTICDTF